ncbi:hypothetical protein NH340_JMT08294 [Sarcoptes scabiei]|nr:hypothetical protein NH340_JMT08294 [Sarcoptes scabiei]
MDNRSFSIDDEIDRAPQTRSDFIGSSKTKRNVSIEKISIEELERKPININRPVIYTNEFYGRDSVLFTDSSREKSTKIQTTSHNECSTIVPTGKNHFDDEYSAIDDGIGGGRLYRKFSQKIRSKTFWIGTLRRNIPIIDWLTSYDLRKDFLADFFAGITILALHIPQGLAYGRLAGVEPINGLYVSLFPMLVYALLGTGRHVSIGTFAVISIACRDILKGFEEAQFSEQTNQNSSIFATTFASISKPSFTEIEILTSLCLLVGFIQFTMGLLRLGVISILLSDTMISAFITGCSLHVFTSQVFSLFDISPSIGDEYQLPLPFDLINSWIRFVLRLPQSNPPTILLSAISVMILVGSKFFFEPFVSRKFKLKNFILPIDLIVIALATLLSKIFDFNQRFQIRLIPEIPKAFEGMPQIPNISLWPKLITSSILICFVSFISTFSLGKIYGTKHGYKVSANKELIALGASNIVSSFFLCYPCAASLGRSSVMSNINARTQLSSLIAGIFMIIFLLFVSNFLQTLPKSILSCLIVVALYSTMKKIKEFRDAWMNSKLDGILWIVTFCLVIFLGVGMGLFYSVIFSFIILILKLITPVVRLKEQVDGSDLFIEIKNLDELIRFRRNNPKFLRSGYGDGIVFTDWIIFEFQGPLLFINTIVMKRKFHELIGKHLLKQSFLSNKSGNEYRDEICSDKNNPLQTINGKDYSETKSKIDSIVIDNGKVFSKKTSRAFQTIIFDLDRLTYIDSKGLETLLELKNFIEQNGSKLILASCSKRVFEQMKRENFFLKFNLNDCYMSLIDALCDLRVRNFNRT